MTVDSGIEATAAAQDEADPTRPPSAATGERPERSNGEPGSEPGSEPGEAVGRPRRSVSMWDVVGVLVLVAAMLAVNQALIAWRGDPLGVGTSRGIRLASVAVGVGTGLLLLAMVLRDRHRLGRVPHLVTDVWRDPPTDLVAFVLGAALALPALGFYWPRQGPHSDSARLLSSVDHVWRGDLGYLAEVQEPYLPHLLYGPVLQVAGLPGTILVAIAGLIALAGVTALITYRVTGSLWGAGAAAFALLCIEGVVARGLYMPMYPLMLTLGYLGGWYAYRAVTDTGARWRYPVVAGVCLALTPEAHALGQLFLAVPVLVAVLAPTRRLALTQTARTFAVVVVAMIPRLAINVADGGLDWIMTYRTDWWVTEGYVRYIQENLWGYEGINEPLGFYLRMLPGRFYNSLGAQGWLVVAGVALGWLCSRWRGRVFILAVLGFMVAVVTVEQIPSFPRYYSPLFPGMAIVTGLLVATLVRQRQWAFRVGAIVCSVALVVGAGVTIDTVHSSAEGVRVATDALPLSRLVASVDDDRGVIGARAHQSFFGVSRDTPTWGDQYLSEEEYVTYLTWPSDEVVIDLMERYDIGWVVMHANLVFETTYNDAWLIPFHGKTARHDEAVAASPHFCRHFSEGGYVLYKRAPCPPPSDVEGTVEVTG